MELLLPAYKYSNAPASITTLVELVARQNFVFLWSGVSSSLLYTTTIISTYHLLRSRPLRSPASLANASIRLDSTRFRDGDHSTAPASTLFPLLTLIVRDGLFWLTFVLDRATTTVLRSERSRAKRNGGDGSSRRRIFTPYLTVELPHTFLFPGSWCHAWTMWVRKNRSR